MEMDGLTMRKQQARNVTEREQEGEREERRKRKKRTKREGIARGGIKLNSMV
jgi:hypothetical protein